VYVIRMVLTVQYICCSAQYKPTGLSNENKLFCLWDMIFVCRVDWFSAPRRSNFEPRPVHVGFLVDRVALGQVFISYIPCQYNSIIGSYPTSSMCYSCQKYQGAKPGSLQKTMLFRKLGFIG